MTKLMSIDIDDALDADLAAILEIHNHAVSATTASWSYRTVDLDDRKAWLAGKRADGFPVLAAKLDGEVAGYASYGAFRAWDGYLHTVESSVYVRPDFHRQGVGGRLLSGLIERARNQHLHVMVAAIGAENAPSITLHARLGFREVGRLPQIGAKFGRWLDLVLMQLILDAAPEPLAERFPPGD